MTARMRAALSQKRIGLGILSLANAPQLLQHLLKGRPARQELIAQGVTHSVDPGNARTEQQYTLAQIVNTVLLPLLDIIGVPNGFGDREDAALGDLDSRRFHTVSPSCISSDPGLLYRNSVYRISVHASRLF